MTLEEGWLLNAKERRRAQSLSEEVAFEGLREMVDEPGLGMAARTALRCVEKRGADPRLMLLVIESAQEGWFRQPGSDPDSGAT